MKHEILADHRSRWQPLQTNHDVTSIRSLGNRSASTRKEEGMIRSKSLAWVTWILSLSTVAMRTAPTMAWESSENQSKPNIVLLLSDDHSYPFLSCYGNANVRTPTLDRLAREGMKCHRFFTSAPQCVPSRAALMTGRSPVACRMTRFSAPLPIDEVTLPELLRQQSGYYTGICGRSFHLDGPGNRQQADAIGRIVVENNLKTFASRVDFLNTCPDNQVAEQVNKFLSDRPRTNHSFCGQISATHIMSGMPQIPSVLTRRP